MTSIISIPDIIFLNAGTNNPNTNDIVVNNKLKSYLKQIFLESFIVQRFYFLI